MRTSPAGLTIRRAVRTGHLKADDAWYREPADWAVEFDERHRNKRMSTVPRFHGLRQKSMCGEPSIRL
jgi:hypothetical protein